MKNSKCHEMSSNVASTKFPPKKEKALIEILKGAKGSEAAAKAGVNERTIQRWFKEPEFQKRLTQGRDEIYKQAMNSIRDASCKGAKRLSELVDSPSDKTAIKACELAITLDLKIREAQKLERRIEELERAVERKSSGRQR